VDLWEVDLEIDGLRHCYTSCYECYSAATSPR